MRIKDSKILVLGGWGLVGAAICHELMKHEPSKIYISSLFKHEAEEAVEQFRNEYKNVDPEMFVPVWGNIFTRTDWKEMNWANVIADKDSRKGVISDIYDELSENILNNSVLYSFITDCKPDLVIDCINTATAIAYQDIYNTVNAVRREIIAGEVNDSTVERMMSSDYIPQLIRHVQILYKGLLDNQVTMYLKIGTSGTGGMGLNIPYTHSEERPSRVLLAKTAVAGSMTLLLMLMARTPNGPLVKEIKPTAAIAWKKIAYGKVFRKGKPIPLVDMKPEDARDIASSFKFSDHSDVEALGKDYESVFIDTEENGIFSRGEFTAISSLGQMEIVTPEEIATYAVLEILGGNSGRDVIQALDASTLGPTYRGGMLQHIAVEKIKNLEKENNVDSVAFELLGPPRLSKLLYEAYLIKRIANSMKAALKLSAADIAAEAGKIIIADSNLRAQMVSIGLVILMPDGKKYLRGKDVKIPVNMGDDELIVNQQNIDFWCKEGWIDLRPDNFASWQDRIKIIIDQSAKISENETSSRYTYTSDYWENFDTIDEGKLIGWIFEYEDKGWRFKR